MVLNLDNDESRRAVEYCFRTTTTLINPINDWTDDDVWDFLHHYGCRSNPLYECGRRRIGCVGCPLQGEKGMKAEFEKYPKIRDNYIRAFGKMLKVREEYGKPVENWQSGVDVLRWWCGDNIDQLTFFEEDYLNGW